MPNDRNDPSATRSAIEVDPTKVFVSSTCYDLKDVRAELRELLTSMGLSPSLSDHPDSEFDIRPDAGDSILQCLQNIESSRFVLCVLSQRYGPKLHGNYGAVSATEAEYRHAVSMGKEIWFYVRDQTMAEYEEWKRQGRVAFAPPPDISCSECESCAACASCSQCRNCDCTKRKKWTRFVQHDGHVDLFNFIARHEPLAEQEKPNWITRFTNSVDLKRSVARHLQGPAWRAQLRRLTSAGELPAISLGIAYRPTTFAQVPDFVVQTLQLEIANHNPKHPALDVELRIIEPAFGGDEKHQLDPISKKPICLYIDRPSHTGSRTLTFVVNYSTIQGLKVSEKWEGTNQPFSCRRVSKEPIGYESWA